MARRNETAAEAPQEYDDILNRGWGEIPQRKTLPLANYVLKADGALYKPATEKSSAKVDFMYRVKEPIDADPAQVAELGDDYEFSANRVTYTVFIESNADFDKVMKHMAKHTGANFEGSIIDTLKAFRGPEVIAFLDTRSYTNRNGELVTINDPKNFQPISAA